MFIQRSPVHTASSLRKKPPTPPAPSDEPSLASLYLGPALVGGGGLALGRAMFLQNQVASSIPPLAESLVPAMAIAGGAWSGAGWGAATGLFSGVAFGVVNQSTAELTGGMGMVAGAALGAVTGAVSTALGATPLLAIPAVILATACTQALVAPHVGKDC